MMLSEIYRSTCDITLYADIAKRCFGKKLSQAAPIVFTVNLVATIKNQTFWYSNNGDEKKELDI